jgi:hypothetical protein
MRQPRQIGQQTILLVDDHALLYRSGTRRLLNPPKRYQENPVLRVNNPWEQGSIGYCSVYRNSESGRYQLWYQAGSGKLAKAATHRVVVCYAESNDGINWVKPKLGIHQFNDTKETNIVLIGNGGYSVNYCASVVVNPNDKDPARRYKMAYWDFASDASGEFPGLCVAFSPDGIHWTKYPKAPLLKGAYSGPQRPPFADEPIRQGKDTWVVPHSVSDVIDASYDPARDVFIIFSKTFVDGPDGQIGWKRGVARIESKDFIHWSTPQVVMAPDEFDDPKGLRAGLGVELHGGPTFFYNDLYLCLLQVLDFRNKISMQVELAISHDSFNWARPFRGNYFIGNTEGGKFDSRVILSNATPVFLEDECRFYYGALSDWDEPLDGTTGIGLATIPRDRFAGLQPIGKLGQITLKPIDLGHCREIMLNADASNGMVRVEVLNENGYLVRGFSEEEGIPIRGDSLKHLARWKNHTIEELPDGRYMLRLHLENAIAYAITFLNSG